MAIQAEYSDDKRHVHAISYGGGTQSTALLLMALKGEVNGIIPDYVIFSDTGWEPRHVYQWIEHVSKYVKEKYGREIIIARKGNIRENVVRASTHGERFVSLPFFTKAADGSKGMARRQCTGEYKIEPFNKKLRELLGYQPRKRVKEIVHVWKGISTDEIQRAKPSPMVWQVAEHPLIDILDMDRDDCIAYVEKEGLGTPPKSSCIGCPFHNNMMWADMKVNDPESWQDAVEIDKLIRNLGKFKGNAYLHRSCRPLEEVEFREQMDIDHFINECEGMCGI